MRLAAVWSPRCALPNGEGMEVVDRPAWRGGLRAALWEVLEVLGWFRRVGHREQT